MARIPYVSFEDLDDKDRQFWENLPPLNIFKMLPHAGPAGRRFVQLGSSLLLEGELDTMLREMAIIRTGILCRSPYEVHQHKRIALNAGMAPEKIEALGKGSSSPLFSEEERLVIKFTEEVVKGIKADDETISEILSRFGNRRAAELILTIGYYMAVSRFLENFEVDIEKK